MEIKLTSTPLRRILKALSVYIEKNRADGITGNVKWEIKETIRIFGYQQPKPQIRLCVIQLNENRCSRLHENRRDFLTDVPSERGIKTAFAGGDILVTADSESDYFTIQNSKLDYNNKRIAGVPKMELRQRYLPMRQCKIKGDIPLRKLWRFFKLAPAGPVRLRIREDMTRFVSDADKNKCCLDLTEDVDTYLDNENFEYVYSLCLLREMMRKFPRDKQVKLFVNNDLIKLQYKLEDNVGHINYYQMSK